MSNRHTFYFSDGPYLETLKGVLQALSAPEAFIKLTGVARSGKSTLCQMLVKYLRRKDRRVIYFQSAIESPEMLRNTLARELDLPESPNFARMLEDALPRQLKRPLILVFDDAHLLTDITLIEIFRLAEAQVKNRCLINVVLCGEPDLDQRLSRTSEFKSMLLQVSHRLQLRPMNMETVARFLSNYADKAGLQDLQLDSGALRLFYKSCKGFPGPAMSLCRLIVAARSQEGGAIPINKAELLTLLQDTPIEVPPPASGVREAAPKLAILPLLAVIVLASLAFLYKQLSQDAEAEAEPEPSGPDISMVSTPFVDELPAAARTNAEAVADDTAPETAAGTELNPAGPAESAAATDSMPIRSEIATTALAIVPAADADQAEDSGLALVTAAERGVAEALISEPEYEAMMQAMLQEIQVSDQHGQASAMLRALDQEPATLAQLLTRAESERESAIAAASQARQLAQDKDQDQDQDQERKQVTEPLVASAADAATDLNPASTAAVVAAVPEPEPVPDARRAVSAVNSVSTVGAANTVSIAVRAWAAAWQSQSLPDYFAHYHPDFEPRYQNSQAAWRSNRERVIGGADSISLNMRGFEILEQSEQEVEVQFWLDYQSPSYRDQTLKKLVLVMAEGGWLIIEEVNLEVRR